MMRPISSRTPSDTGTAAPMVKRIGIARKYLGILLSDSINRPNVEVVCFEGSQNLLGAK